MTTHHSRRNFLKFGAGLSALAALGNARNARAATTDGYRALVCIFLTGGNDGNNLIVPLDGAQYAAYKAIRGNLVLPPEHLLEVSAGGARYGLHYGLPELKALYLQQKVAVVANVGMLVKPTTRAQYLAQSVAVPTNLFSHADQIVQMQSGVPSSSGGSGWGGRLADAVRAANAGATLPASISFGGQSVFCTGNVVSSTALEPGDDLTIFGVDIYPPAAGATRNAALKEIVSTPGSNNMINAANQVLAGSYQMADILKSAINSPLTTKFPGSDIGSQLDYVARMIKLRGATGQNRQVFFCRLDGFDTHSAQEWQQWDLLSQLSAAMAAFYQATVEMGVADQVITFTESDFGRTLQPNNTGSDHAWGNHHLVMGGAVKGGTMYGQFPTLALGGPNDANDRGVWIPTTSLSQYAATMGRWFGASDAELLTVFPELANFSSSNVGFL